MVGLNSVLISVKGEVTMRKKQPTINELRKKIEKMKIRQRKRDLEKKYGMKFGT